jgi:hypothetical protein
VRYGDAVSASKATYAAKFARYCALREGGTSFAEAGAAVGLSFSTNRRYENGYRNLHPEIPPYRNQYEKQPPRPGEFK